MPSGSSVSAVISGVVVEQVGVDVRVKFGDFRSNRSRDIRAAHFVVDAHNDERTTTTPATQVIIT